MKVIPASSQKYNQNYGKSNLSLPQATVNNTGLKSDVAFGSFGSSAKNAATGVFKWIDKMGFFVEFLIVDAISLIAPRIWIGLKRDKDKTGHYNYKAGAEEAGREMTSGPSMNIIPMMFFAAMSMIKPATHIEKDTLNCLTHHISGVVNDAKGHLNSKTLHKKFADRLFDDAFGTFDLEEKVKLKEQFSKLLTEVKDLKERSNISKLFDKIRGIKPDPYGDKVGEFEKLIVKINSKNKKVITDEPRSIKLNPKEGISSKVSAGELIKDFKDYSNDIIAKFTKQNIAKNQSESFLQGITKRRIGIKYATTVAAFFALGSFLLYLPKLYQQGKISPAEQSAKLAEGGYDEN